MDTLIAGDLACRTCGAPLSYDWTRAHYAHADGSAPGHPAVPRAWPKGHDAGAATGVVVGYVPDSLVADWRCHDCGGPIRARQRCWRRIDQRQDMPVVCEGCRELAALP